MSNFYYRTKFFSEIISVILMTSSFCRRCFDTDRGYQLQIQAARKTASVRPHPVPEVPYLLVNDYSPNTETNNLNIHAIRHLLKKWFRNHKRGSR